MAVPALPGEAPPAAGALSAAKAAMRAGRPSCAYAHAIEARRHDPRDWAANVMAAVACQMCGRLDLAAAFGLRAAAAAPPEPKGSPLPAIIRGILDEYAAPLVIRHRVECNAPPPGGGLLGDCTRLSASVRFQDAESGADLGSVPPTQDVQGVRRVGGGARIVRACARVRVHLDLVAMFDDIKLLALTATTPAGDRVLGAATLLLEHAEGEYELSLLLEPGWGRTKLRVELNTERAEARAAGSLVVHVV
jgi:hypothetical protein